jgi:hypothetical protein
MQRYVQPCCAQPAQPGHNRANGLSYVLSACRKVVPHRAGLQPNDINALYAISYSNVEYVALIQVV